jgi:predicted N-acetyltransferase YhbS
MFDIKFEQPQDIIGIRKVHEPALEIRAEANLIDALRDKKAGIISLVATVDGFAYRRSSFFF